MDHRSGPPGQLDRRCQVQRFAASVDGGRTFSAPVTTSSEPSCPFTRANAESARMWPAGTHYGALVGLPDGGFRSVWADARSGIYQIRMGTVVVR